MAGVLSPGLRTQQALSLPGYHHILKITLLSLDLMFPRGKNCPSRLLLPTETRMGSTHNGSAARVDGDQGGLSSLLGVECRGERGS